MDHAAAPDVGVEDAEVGGADAELGAGERGEEDDLSGVGVFLGCDGVLGVVHEEIDEVAASAVSDLAVLAGGIACSSELM